MNKVMLMGRLTRDPDIRYSNRADGQDTVVAKYTLAVDRRVKRDGEPTADFISCVAFGSNGAFVEKYLQQGTKITVCGRIQTGSYTNREGRKVYTTDVVVEEHYFCESRGQQEDRQRNQQAPKDERGQQPPAKEVGEGFMEIPEGYEQEGLPFA